MWRSHEEKTRDTSGCPEGRINTEPAVLEPAFYWLVKWVACFWHHLPDLLMHKEASH